MLSYNVFVYVCMYMYVCIYVCMHANIFGKKSCSFPFKYIVHNPHNSRDSTKKKVCLICLYLSDYLILRRGGDNFFFLTPLKMPKNN